MLYPTMVIRRLNVVYLLVKYSVYVRACVCVCMCEESAIFQWFPVFVCHTDSLKAFYLPFAPFSAHGDEGVCSCVCARESKHCVSSWCGWTACPKQAF